jgi:hypothetical protein
MAFKYLKGQVFNLSKDEFGNKVETDLGELKKLRVAWQSGFTGFNTMATTASETTEAKGTMFASSRESPILAKGHRVRVKQPQDGRTYIWRVKSDPMWTLHTQNDRYSVEVEVVV